MTAVPLYRTPIAPEWIDYNGHLRDAYYGLIISLAIHKLMDQLGLDAPYRERTRCTLYTVEMHIHYLKEVHKDDLVLVGLSVLASDPKRIHAALELSCEGRTEPAATAEVMLLHVRQGDSPATVPFPPAIAEAIERLRVSSQGGISGPGSRVMQLGRRA
jgi:acyl-CoA thioester hydrolase